MQLLAAPLHPLALVLATAPALAEDYYVDPVFGDDANGGSQVDPWQHASYALSVTGSADVVHLTPGMYDAAGGEVYPLPLNGARVLGDGGSEATVLEGGWFQGEGGLDAQGLTLRGGSTGVSSQGAYVHLRLVDVRILDMSGSGIAADAYNGGYHTRIDLHLERVTIRGCGGQGVWLRAQSHDEWGNDYPEYAEVFVEATDSELSECGGWGLWCWSEHVYDDGGSDSSAHSQVGLDLSRCRFTWNGRGGIAVERGVGDFRLEDSLVARSGWSRSSSWPAEPVSGEPPSPGVWTAWLPADVRRTTIADNRGVGLRYGGAVTSSILHGNDDDLVLAQSIDHSLVDDPDAPEGTGNVAGPPGFVDPASGDYRLRFGSPCVDAGDPDALDVLDLDGRSRPLDGDLDSAKRIDMGAHELAPLTRSGEPVLGGTVQLELWGPPAGKALVWCAWGSTSAPLDTPFGEWLLGHPHHFYASTSTAPGPPSTLAHPIPDDPALLGQSISFQALSGQGGPNRAYTNAITLTFLE